MTTIQERQAMMAQLESMVDRESLTSVVDMLIDICGEKAEHVRSTWQDSVQAKDWERNARVLENANQRLCW